MKKKLYFYLSEKISKFVYFSSQVPNLKYKLNLSTYQMNRKWKAEEKQPEVKVYGVGKDSENQSNIQNQ